MEESLLKIKILGIIPEVRAISKILSSSLIIAQLSATPCELCLYHRLSPNLSAVWGIVVTAVKVEALLWPLLLQTSNLRTEHSFLFK